MNCDEITRCSDCPFYMNQCEGREVAVKRTVNKEISNLKYFEENEVW